MRISIVEELGNTDRTFTTTKIFECHGFLVNGLCVGKTRKKKQFSKNRPFFSSVDSVKMQRKDLKIYKQTLDVYILSNSILCKVVRLLYSSELGLEDY